MGFWIFMLVCDLFIPIVIILGGFFMWKYPPNRINGIIGYRTRRSRLNMDTWLFAHEYCGKLWWIGGWIIFALSLIVMLLVIKKSQNTVASVGGILCVVQTMLILLSIIPTEKALKKNFTEDGQRK